MKTCRRCDTTKEDGEFYRHSHRPDGLQSQCKACQDAYPRHRAPHVYNSAKDLPRLRKYCTSKHGAAKRAAYNASPAGHSAARKWRQSDKGRMSRQVRHERRRANLYSVPHDLAPSDWGDILFAFDHRCAYCLRQDRKLTMDHVVPVSRGGPTTVDNIVPACGPCNSSKGARV